MPRIVASVAGLAALAVATLFFLPGGTGSIHTAPLPSATSKLTPNPPHIYVAPFDTTTGKLRARIKVGDGPHGLCVYPQPGRYSLGHTGNMR